MKKAAGIIAGWIPQQLLKRLSRQKIIFPCYHAVSDECPAHIVQVFPCRSRVRFEKDLAYLLKHFRPAGLDELKIWMEDPAGLDGAYFLPSFDDGLREVYENAAPLLKKLGIPAIIFLNTDFLDNRSLSYRYKASLILDRLETVQYSPGVTEILRSRFDLRSNDRKTVSGFILSIRYDRRQILDEIAGILDLDFETFLRVKRPYMDTGEVKDLASRGFYIGAHSLDHPDFSLLSQEEQFIQYNRSLEVVKTLFGQREGLFAFPFGDDGSDPGLFGKMRKKGGLLASFGTAGLKCDPVEFHCQRISMEKPALPASARIKGEYLASFVRTVLGRNTVCR